jgi:hypothetical protein
LLVLPRWTWAQFCVRPASVRNASTMKSTNVRIFGVVLDAGAAMVAEDQRIIEMLQLTFSGPRTAATTPAA